MMQNSLSQKSLGRAGNLAPLHQNIVAPGCLRGHSQPPQRFHHRPGKLLIGDGPGVFHIRHPGIVQISKIVVYRASAGHSAHHPNSVGFHKGVVDLLLGVLVLPDHNRVVILPQEKGISLSAVLQDNLLKRQVISRVRTPCLQIKRICCHSASLCRQRALAFLSEIRQLRGPFFQEGRPSLPLVVGGKGEAEGVRLPFSARCSNPCPGRR